MFRHPAYAKYKNLMEVSDTQTIVTTARVENSWLLSEPNSARHEIPGDMTTTASISAGETVYETLEVASDSDWFQLDLAESEAVSVQLVGMDHNPRNDVGRLQVYNLTIYDSDGNVVAFNDYYGAGASATILFEADQAGTYFVEVADPWDYYVGDYSLSVSALTNYAPDYIPGDLTTTETIAIGETRRESVDFIGDTDWFQIDLAADESVTISAVGSLYNFGNGLKPLREAEIHLYDSQGNLVASGQVLNWFTDPLYEQTLNFTASSDGTYFIEVGAYYDAYAGDYRVTVEALSTEDTIPGDASTSEFLGHQGFRAETLETAGDTDWFRMHVDPFTYVSFDLYGSDHNAVNDLDWLSDPILRVYNWAGQLVFEAEPEYGFLGAENLDFLAFSGGTYFVEVASVDDAGAGDYILSSYFVSSGSFGPHVEIGDVVIDSIAGYDPPDYYHVTLDASDSVLIVLAGRNPTLGDGYPALDDPSFKLYNSKGQLVAVNDDRLLSDSTDSVFVFTPQKSGEFVIEVSTDNGYSGEYVLLVDDLNDAETAALATTENVDAFVFDMLAATDNLSDGSHDIDWLG